MRSPPDWCVHRHSATPLPARLHGANQGPSGKLAIGERAAPVGLAKVCSVQISHTHLRVEFPGSPSTERSTKERGLKANPAVLLE